MENQEKLRLIFQPPQKYIQPLQNVKAGYGPVGMVDRWLATPT